MTLRVYQVESSYMGKPEEQVGRRTTQQLIDASVVYLGFVCSGGDPAHLKSPAFIRQVPGEAEAASIGIYEQPDTYAEPVAKECPIYQRNGGKCGAKGQYKCEPAFDTVYYGPGIKK